MIHVNMKNYPFVLSHGIKTLATLTFIVTVAIFIQERERTVFHNLLSHKRNNNHERKDKGNISILKWDFRRYFKRSVGLNFTPRDV